MSTIDPDVYIYHKAMIPYPWKFPASKKSQDNIYASFKYLKSAQNNKKTDSMEVLLEQINWSI